VYTFSLGTVRNVDKTNFSRLNNQYELSFHAQSIIKPVLDDQSIKKQQLSIVKIRNIAEYSTNSIIDVVGVVRGYSELALITATKYSEKQFLKRELTLVDDSLCEVRLTLWNDHANVKCDWSMYPILVLKGVKVQDYQGVVHLLAHHAAFCQLILKFVKLSVCLKFANHCSTKVSAQKCLCLIQVCIYCIIAYCKYHVKL
jgi:hypothetical protein